jgi:hypothetical protein
MRQSTYLAKRLGLSPGQRLKLTSKILNRKMCAALAFRQEPREDLRRVTPRGRRGRSSALARTPSFSPEQGFFQGIGKMHSALAFIGKVSTIIERALAGIESDSPRHCTAGSNRKGNAMTKASQPSRPRWNPRHSGRARELAGLGLEPQEIALLMRLPLQVLASLYADEIRRGPMEANVQVAEALHQAAVGTGRRYSIAAALFWMRTRGAWHDDGGEHPMGKKALQQLAARSSVQGTSWAGLLDEGPES